MAQWFLALSYAPGPFWLLVLFWPANRHAMLAVDAFLLALAALFTVQTVPAMGELFPIILKPEFAKVHAAMSTEAGFLGTWNHMILADLWIGRWIAQDSLRSSRSLLVRLAFIPPVILFGPLGLFLYLLWRLFVRREFALTAG